MRDYSYYGTVTFTNNRFGSELIQRTIECGVYYELIDDTAPTAYGYSNNVTNNEYWKVIGNGTKEKTSTQASVTVTFKDSQQYSYNQLRIRVFDEDKTTVLPQGNGDTYVALTKIPGTSGSNTLWTGSINILTEVNGSKNIYIQAIDSTGYQSTLIPMQISYLDSKGPEITVSVDNNNIWSKNKLVTVTGTDEFGRLIIGVDKDDLVEVSNSTFNNKRIYNMTGDVYTDKTFTFYATDISGNLVFERVAIGKLDNTAPTITQISSNISENKKTTTLTVQANDINTQLQKEGSGITGYQITTTNTAPTDFQASNIFTVSKNGTYYLWVIDAVGNISQPNTINIVDLEIDVIGNITWNDQDNKYNSRIPSKIKLYRKIAQGQEEYVAEQNIVAGQNNYLFQTRECDDSGNKYEFITRAVIPY